MKNRTCPICNTSSEEVSASGKAVLVLREATEPPKDLEHGFFTLVGSGYERIVQEDPCLHVNKSIYQSMARTIAPFGERRASRRIVQALQRHFNA